MTGAFGLAAGGLAAGGLALVATLATAAAARPAPVATATLDATATAITVTGRGGQRTYRPETAGDTFGPPRLSPDRRTVGWTVLRVAGATYAAPISLEFRVGGRRRGFVCDGGVPQAWRFAGNRHAVVDCAFPHGDAQRRRVLVDIATAHVDATVAMPADGPAPAAAPPWARPDLPVP